MSTTPRHVPLIILGSGPAGCTAAVYASRANLQPLLIQGLEPGGQLTTTTDVENWPADTDGVLGPDLMRRFIAHAGRYGADLASDHIESVRINGRRLSLAGSGSYTCGALIVATGARAKYLDLPSEREYLGRGVSACATCDGFFFRGKDVAVIGGGNTAAEEALYLADICASVTLVHRRDEFRAESIMQKRLFAKEREGGLKIIRSHVVDEILGDGNKVTGLRIRHADGAAGMELALSGVFVAVGHAPNTGMFEGKLNMKNGYLSVCGGDSGYATRTSAENVFAAGDVADSVYRQAVTSAATGCMAALDAVRYLRENGHA